MKELDSKRKLWAMSMSLLEDIDRLQDNILSSNQDKAWETVKTIEERLIKARQHLMNL